MPFGVCASHVRSNMRSPNSHTASSMATAQCENWHHWNSSPQTVPSEICQCVVRNTLFNSQRFLWSKSPSDTSCPLNVCMDHCLALPPQLIAADSSVGCLHSAAQVLKLGIWLGRSPNTHFKGHSLAPGSHSGLTALIFLHGTPQALLITVLCKGLCATQLH